MITKVDGNPEALLFVVDEDKVDPEFLVRLKLDVTLALKNDLHALTEDPYFLKVLDKKLSHIYTILDLFLERKIDSIERIEYVQQKVYEATWLELMNEHSVPTAHNTPTA